MCGISGIINKDGETVSRERIQLITDLVAHRGPDGSGIFTVGNLAFGHRRLSIIDLNERGRQPMQFRGRYWITYNGEVFNYLEIRKELESLGCVFKTGTDTEVILAAYAEWGADCLARFNGMWAFAIYDEIERTIFLARDRFGVKPLYYSDSDTEFAFGSEIKQIVALQDRPRANQWAVIESLLTYFDGHTEQTFFAGVMALPHSHYMIYDLKNHKKNIVRYYQLQIDPELQNLPLEEATARCRALLEDSIRLRLRSDVKVGTCLSGGLDSSAISALASRSYKAESGQEFIGIHAKSIEVRTDESRYARQVADHAGIKLACVQPGTEDFVSKVDEVVYTQEEPFGSPSMFMGWHVFQEAARQNCKVMLNGQGGDEVFLGYERYYAALLTIKSPLAFMQSLYQQALNSKLSMAVIFKYYLYFTKPWLRIRHLKKRSFLRPELVNAHNFQFVKNSAASFANVQELQKYEIQTLQLSHLLRYEDRNSMRHSIETRLPFLDYRLVEAGISLPGNYKIRDGWTKFVLRKAVTDSLPNDIVWRKNKLGFEAPERIWLGAHESAMIEEIRKSRILEEIACKDSLIKAYHKLSLKEKWAYYNLAVWERVYGVSWK